VCEAVKFVEAKSSMSGVVANRAVAETLLRAKVGPALKPDMNAGILLLHDTPGLESLRICNPGSVGHPQLCSRACLYFALGKCTNGMSCDFCHAPHSKRATHLDKRHREMLRGMGFAERLYFIHAILKAKLIALEVSPETMHGLEVLNASSSATVQSKMMLQTDRKKNKELRTLQVALKFLSVRSLLTLLQHAPLPENSPEMMAVAELVSNVKPDPGNMLRGGDEDSQSQKSVGPRSRHSFQQVSRTPSPRSERDPPE